MYQKKFNYKKNKIIIVTVNVKFCNQQPNINFFQKKNPYIIIKKIILIIWYVGILIMNFIFC